jgi:hypothetical protein
MGGGARPPSRCAFCLTAGWPLRACNCGGPGCRFVCDFVDEVPDDVFGRLTPAGQGAFEPVTSTTGVKTRLPAQYFVMAMHNMSLADALAEFKVWVLMWWRATGGIHGRSHA